MALIYVAGSPQWPGNWRAEDEDDSVAFVSFFNVFLAEEAVGFVSKIVEQAKWMKY